MAGKLKPSAAKTLLAPDNCAVVFIDHQEQMTFGVANIERQALINNVVGLAKSAKAFNIPTILSATGPRPPERPPRPASPSSPRRRREDARAVQATGQWGCRANASRSEPHE